MLWPHDADVADCSVVHRTGGLIVEAPSARVVFAMKLYRALPQDHEDMVLLWPMCGFANPVDAADAFLWAYPHAPDDEFLADYIEGIATEADCPR